MDDGGGGGGDEGKVYYSSNTLSDNFNVVLEVTVAGPLPTSYSLAKSSPNQTNGGHARSAGCVDNLD